MEKKIYLLLPFISRDKAYSSRVGDIIDGEHVPLGIYYIASYLRENGYAVKATDALALRLSQEDILSDVNDFSPSFIGISAMSVVFPTAVSIAHAFKRRFPNIPIIIGGRHVTSNFEHAMSFQEFDFGVIGEGEISTLELLEVLTSQKTRFQSQRRGLQR